MPATVEERLSLIAAMRKARDEIMQAVALDTDARRDFRARYSHTNDVMMQGAAEFCALEDGTIYATEQRDIVDAIQAVSDLVGDIVDQAEEVANRIDDKVNIFEHALGKMPVSDTARPAGGGADAIGFAPDASRTVDGPTGYSSSGQYVVATSEAAIGKLNEAAEEIRTYLRQLDGRNDFDREAAGLELRMLVGTLHGIAIMLEHAVFHLGLAEDSRGRIRKLSERYPELSPLLMGIATLLLNLAAGAL